MGHPVNTDQPSSARHVYLSRPMPYVIKGRPNSRHARKYPKLPETSRYLSQTSIMIALFTNTQSA